MAEKIDVGMPQDLDLDQGWTIRFTALDSSGAVVSGVNVSTASITAEQLTGGSLDFGSFVAINPLLLGVNL